MMSSHGDDQMNCLREIEKVVVFIFEHSIYFLVLTYLSTVISIESVVLLKSM